MINNLFVGLTSALNGTTTIAIFAAFLWGILSILLSPCHLSSIPLVIGFISERREVSTKNAFYISSLFSIGILTTIALIGVVTSLTGRMLGDIGSWGNYFVAIIFFLVGLNLMEIISLPFIGGMNQPKFKKKGLLEAFILGLIFGIALGPCTFAYMAPILSIAFKLSSSSQLVFGLILIIAYGIGHCSVIVFFGTFSKIVQRYLNWTDRSKGVLIIKKISGILVIIAGIYLIWKV